MSTINYLTVRNTVMPVVNAVTANYSTLTGSTLTGNAVLTSTLQTSTLTVSTMNFASTIISLGQSTNQTYNNFSNGSFAAGSWVTAKSAMSAANKTVQSANGLYQLIVANATSGLYLSSDSGITWSTLSGGLPTLTGSAYWSDGAISANGQYITLSIYGGSLWMSQDYGRTFALTNQPTPNIWLPLNGNTTDLMGSSTVTATGSPSYVTLNYPGYTAQAINLVNSSGNPPTMYVRGTWVAPSLGSFTVSLWFNAQSIGGYPYLFGSYTNQFVIAINTLGQIYLYTNTVSGVTSPVTTSFSISTNTWYYISASFSSNGTGYMYVNNNLIGTYSCAASAGTSSGIFAIGHADNVIGNAFNGYIDDLRITNSVSAYVPIPLLQPNIWMPFENTAGDLGSYSLPPSATPTIYLPFEGNVTDSMGASTVTATGPVTYVAANREGYTGQAIRLTNTSGSTALQYVRGSRSAVTSQTISFWFNMQTGSAAQYLYTAYYNGILIGINTDNTVYLRLPVNSVYSTTSIVSSAISTSTWYYVTAIVNIGGTCSFYLNNTLVGTYANTGFGDYGSSGSFGLGTTEQGAASNAFNGLIDDFRFYNSAIPYVPVSNVNITGSLSYVPGVVGLNAVNLVNTASGTATNYVTGFISPGNNFTISGWFNAQSLSGGTCVVLRLANSSNNFVSITCNTSNIGFGYWTGSADVTIGTLVNISVNTWYHFVLIVSIGGTGYAYVNGQSVGSAAVTGLGGTIDRFILGANTGSPISAFNGYIDDFRIYNAAIPIHVLFPQNYRSLALSGTGQYALASAASGWVVGSSDTSRTWEKEAVTVGRQSDFIQPNLSGLTATTWTQNGVTWTATESSNNGSTQSVSRAFNNNTTTDAWLSNNTTQRYTAGATNANAASTTIQTVGATAGEWIQIQTSVPMVLASFAFGIGLNAYGVTNTPKTYYIVGSTDGTTWVPLQFGNFTISAWIFASSNITMNITGTQTLTGNMVGSVATTAYPSYTNNAYTYFRLIGTSLMLTGPGGTYMEVGEWYLNFVRPFSLYSPPTHALSMNHTGQYQMVATGPAAGSIMPNLTGLVAYNWSHGGVNWTASSSSVYLNLFAYGAFNTVNSAVGSYSWASNMGTYSTTSPFACVTGISTTIQGIGPTVGEWLQLQSSVPLVMQSYTYGCGGFPNIPKNYYIIGSNDGSTWFPIQLAIMTTNPFTANFQLASTYIIVNQSGTQTISGAQTGSGSFTTYATTTNAYTYFRIVITNLYGNSTLTELGEWYINFSNSVSYSTNYGSTWLNTSRTVSNESVALSASGQYALSTNSVAPFARLTLDNTNVDAQGVLGAPTVVGTSFSYDTTKVVGTHSINFANTAGATSSLTYLNYTVPATLYLQNTLTMSCWIYPTANPASGNPCPMGFNNGSTSPGTLFQIVSGTNYLNFSAWTTTGGTVSISTTTAVILNTWTHLVGTYSNGVVSFYVNGVLQGIANVTGSLSVLGGTNMTNLFIGAAYTTWGGFRGNVDDVRIYTSALNADEISGLFKNPALTQTIAVSSSYLPITSYLEPTLPGITANIVDAAVSQTGQYMVAVTSSTTNNVYYSTDYGATFTALTVGSSAMVSCSISYDGSYLTVESATTVHTLNRNTRGFSVTAGNQAGLVNQAQNAIAIGNQAGRTNQSANSIVLNATGNALDAVAPGFYVAPIGTTISSNATSFALLGYGTDNQVTQTNLTVLSNGNIGLGTTAPTSYFQVANGLTSEISGSLRTQYTSLGYTAATLASPNAANGSVSGPVNGVYTFTLNSGGQDAYYNGLLPAGAFVQISITLRSSSSNVQLAIIDTTNFSYYYLTPVLTNTLTTYTFTARISSSTQLFTRLLGGSNGSSWSWSDFSVQRMDTLMTGNVGIGSGFSSSVAPAASLDVNGSIITRAQTPCIAFLGDIDGAKWTQKLGGYNLAFGSDSGLFTGFEAGNIYGRTYQYGVQMTGTGGMNIKSNVGIGTVAPNAPLHVIGIATSGLSGNPPMSLINSSATSHRWDMGPNTSGDFVIFRNDVGAWLNKSNPGAGWNLQSDLRLKDEIEPITHCLDKITALRPVSYRWKSDMDSPYKSFGLIAQEAKDVIPEMVSALQNTTHGEIYGVTYTTCIPFLIGAVKELSSTVMKLQEENVQMKSQMSSLLTWAQTQGFSGAF